MGDDNCECPLCMEPFEVDDISFYPCTCEYQICRFCWHRLKIDGNGLCPACRKAYSENPAHFEPLSEDEIVRIKKERRHKEVQKKQKLTENRRHLSDVRVVQKNLVFVVGLSHRLADMDILKKNEYFGKFGKITKVVINSSPSYAGAQTPSASAYVTYSKADEALKAIQTVNNVQIDNRTLKASLGTTKYCSHFLKGIQCPKVDCMYLHDLGEDNASFTKEQMSQGKHLEYESKLIENVLHIPRNLQNISNDQSNQIIINQIHQGLPSANTMHSSNTQNIQPQTSNQNSNSNSTTSNPTQNTTQQSLQTNNNYTNNGTVTPNSTNPPSTSNSNNTGYNAATTNSNNNFDKNDPRSKLKKQPQTISKTPYPQRKDSLPMKNISNKIHDINTHKKDGKKNKESSSKNYTGNDEEYNEDTEEVEEGEIISEEEILASGDNNYNKIHITQQKTSKTTNTKSYLSALSTDESKTIQTSNAESETTQQPKTQINYKDMLEKNIIVAQTKETESSNVRSERRDPVILQNVKEINVKDNYNITEISDITESLSTQHIVQESEDLGFDPWDEATKSLQDLMKIESGNTHLDSNSKPLFSSKSSTESTRVPNSSNQTQNKSGNSTTEGPKNNLTNGDNRQYLLQQNNINSNIFKNDLYKIQSNGINGIQDLNQLYQNHLSQNKDNLLNNDTNIQQQKLNELLLANNSNSNHHPFTNGISNTTNPDIFNHENYLNKLLIQKQHLNNGNIKPSNSSLAAPPGFSNTNTNNIVFNSPISTSSTSSSSSSTSSSVNNSTSTTPALNQNPNLVANTNNKANTNTGLINDFNNEYNSLDSSKLDNPSKSMNPPNNLQDTFRSLFPNANISFGGNKNLPNTNNLLNNNKLSNNFDSKLSNYSNSNNQSNNNYSNNSNMNNQFASGPNPYPEKNNPISQKGCWHDDPAIVSLNNGQNGQVKDLNAQFNDSQGLGQDRNQTDYDNIYTNKNKQLEQLSYLTSSLNQQQAQMQQQNNLTNLLKKQQNNSNQFNNSLINQFQLLYQQHQLAQFQNASFLNNTANSNLMLNNNNIGNMNGKLGNSNNGNQDSMSNKSLEDLHNHQQKLLLLNNSNGFNGLNGNTNNLLSNYLNNDLNQFTNTNSNLTNNNNYGNNIIDYNQNIQSTNLNGGLKSQNQQNNGLGQGSQGGNGGLPQNILNLQQQTYMQQLLLQNFNTNSTPATANSNSD